MDRRLFVAAILVAGCATQYLPRADGRIATVVRGGKPTHAKDGVVAPAGQLTALVRGNPRAEAEARTYEKQKGAGSGLVWGGAGTIVAGIAIGFVAAPVAIGMIVVGWGAEMTGSGLLVAAEPHRQDAINIYNDGLAATSSR